MRIKVTRYNFPKVLQVLKNIFEGPVELKSQYNVKRFKYANISDEFLTYYRTAKIERHWMLKPGFQSIGPKSNLKPVIHIDFLSGGHEMIIEEGDVVDLGNGSTLIVRRNDKFIKEILNENHFTTSFRKVKLEDIEDELLEDEVSRAEEMASYESLMNNYFEID